MGNLIIKGKGGAGNKLIIQDQAGGAVMTTADSGATLGNSTQDNITRLGTVTTGTLSNSITFPAGHIVQTVYFNYPGGAGDTSSTSYVVAGPLTITIDPIFANSLIEVDWYVSSTHYNKGNGNCKGQWILRNVTQGHYIAGSRLDTWYHGGNSHLYMPTYGQGHEVLSTGASQTYTVYVKSASSQTFYWANPATGSYGTGAEDPQMRMTAREIKQ